MSVNTEGERSVDDTMSAIKKQKKLRATAKAGLTRRYNELKQLMEHPGTIDIEKVKDKRIGLEKALKELESIHQEYVGMLNEVEDKEEAEAYFTLADNSAKEALMELDIYVQTHTIQEILENTVNPEDSLSRVSVTSSTTSSAKACVAARKAGLLAKAATMERQREIELAELKLKQEKEKLNLDTEIAMATAEGRPYAEIDTQTSDTQTSDKRETVT